MRTGSFAGLIALVAAVSIVAGCSAANGHGGPAIPPLQLRIVTSSVQSACTAPPLTSDGPGSACDGAGTTTYELAGSLGVVTPTSVTLDSQGTGQTVVAAFDEADAGTLRDVTSNAVDKQLAVLLDGKVLSAPVVKEPFTAGKVTFAFGTAAEAKQVAVELGAAATS